ncbi:hypothetical protein GGU10DRAFT_274557 [Lentinula aff. detonsa]|uniref:NAD(P)-binding protein n=1 Tax=Lentinula aff. detonsa TaxID=2804958 RepID=A0AA38NP42_9AGAR|nr:hypothetical protein GGU10DRAFT_274557 [Lentinula aff. detonsa]
MLTRLNHPSAYSTSQAALNSYTITLGHELREEGIRVNAVTPGITAIKFNEFLGNGTAKDGAKVLLPFALLEAEDEPRTSELS